MVRLLFCHDVFVYSGDDCFCFACFGSGEGGGGRSLCSALVSERVIERGTTRMTRGGAGGGGGSGGDGGGGGGGASVLRPHYMFHSAGLSV